MIYIFQLNNIADHYIPIRVLSSFSLLHSTLNIQKILEREANDTIAIIDHNLSWILDYGLTLQKQNKKIIIGYQTNYLGYEIVFYVQNDIGYNNLCKIYSQGFHMAHAEGLICTIASDNREIIINLQKIFDNNLYILVNRSSKNEILLADELNINILCDYTICHLNENDKQAYQALRAISEGKYLSQMEYSECSWLSNEALCQMYHDIPDAIYNSYTLAQKCLYIIKEETIQLPEFHSVKTINSLAMDGLRKRKFHNNEIYCTRLKHELSIINKMRFDGYFLIVSDFVRYAKSVNIPVGPGRGSGAGSLVAFCLEITDIDPIEMGLFFERFLNPNRVSMPDFDIDFCPMGRQRVVEYLQKKYGYNNVAYISTFGKLQTKAALRDVARVLSIPFPVINNICNMIPFIPVKPFTLSDTLELQNIQNEIENDQSLVELFNIALQIEGLHRHESIHAAGIVISKKSLLESVPTKIDSNKQLVISCEVSNIEKAGLVKFDLLGLANLTIIHKLCTILNINIKNIPMNDKKTFSLLALGDTHGVFQLEGKAMKDILIKLHVSSLQEISAVGALYRPGPMANIPSFIANKHNPKKIKYAYDEMKEILKETFGIIVYQEQVLQIAQYMAGYTVGEADLLRRAMGKKKPEEMKLHREKFINGIITKTTNHNLEQASNLFDEISRFAGYAFCKAHAVPYGLISYQTAYLKANYRYEFICTMLNMNINNTIEIENIIRNSKCKIIGPDINLSDGVFKIVTKDDTKYILYGLYAIKNMSHKLLSEFIVMKRNFQSIREITFLNLNRTQWENLIFSGAMNSFHENDKDMIDILQHNDKYQQQTLFSIETIEQYVPPLLSEVILREKKSLGFVLTKISCPVLYKYSGFQLGYISKSEKYKNGMYKLSVVTDNKLYYLFNRMSFANLVIYKNNLIYESTIFLKNISNITISLNNIDEIKEFSEKILPGQTEVILSIEKKLYKLGKFTLNIDILNQYHVDNLQLKD